MAVALLMVLSACVPAEDAQDLDLVRGRNALEMGRYDWARVYFAADLERHPERTESLRGLGLGWISGYQGSMTKAIAEFESYLKLVPDDAEIRLRLARTYQQIGDSEGARQVAEGLEASDAKRLLLAQISLASDPLAAGVQVDAVLAKTPDDFAALLLAAQIQARLGQDQQALDLARRAAGAEPLNADVFYLMANLLRRLGKLREAEESLATYEILRRLLTPGVTASPAQQLTWLRQIEDRLQPTSLSFRRRLARAFLETGQPAEASPLLAELSSDPRCEPECLLVLAQSAHTRGQTSIARDLYQRVLDQEPDHPQALAQQARLAYDAHDFETAHRLLDRGLDLYPQQAPLHFTAGLVALAEGDEPGAVTALSAAVELVPWLAHYRLTLADVLLTRGDRDAVDRLLAGAPAPDPEIDAYLKQHAL